MAAASSSSKTKKLSEQEIINGFNLLRAEQRNLMQKICDLEAESREHSLVIKTLKDVDTDRKCFRMIGGVLVELTVKEVLPDIQENEQQMNSVLDALRKQCESKGEELQKYKETHGLRIQGEKEAPDGKKENDEAQSKDVSSGVLCSQ